MNAIDNIEVRRRRARFRAYRRGFREVDLLFIAFAEAHLDSLDGNELCLFEALLDAPDWKVYAWLMGHEEVPSEFDHSVFRRLCAYQENSRAKA